MTNDEVKELASEFLHELMCTGVEEHTLARMIRSANKPSAYLDRDADGKIKWSDTGLDIDPIDHPTNRLELKTLLTFNSHRCTGCGTVLTEEVDGPTSAAARVYRDNVRTGVLCGQCLGDYQTEAAVG